MNINSINISSEISLPFLGKIKNPCHGLNDTQARIFKVALVCLIGLGILLYKFYQLSPPKPVQPSTSNDKLDTKQILKNNQEIDKEMDQIEKEFHELGLQIAQLEKAIKELKIEELEDRASKIPNKKDDELKKIFPEDQKLMEEAEQKDDNTFRELYKFYKNKTPNFEDHEIYKLIETNHNYQEVKNNNEKIKQKIAPEVWKLDQEFNKITLELLDMKKKKEIFEAQMKPLHARRKELDQKVNFAKVQKLACASIDNELSEHPKNYIETITTFFKKKVENSEPLESYWVDYQEEIKEFHKMVYVEYKNRLGAEGRDAVNRWLVNSAQDFLNDPNKILALFALEAAKENRLILVDDGITIPSMIRYVFDSTYSYLAITALPPNQPPTNYLPFEDYLTRRENCLKKISALQEAVGLLPVKISAKQVMPSKYASDKWKIYAQRLIDFTNKIRNYQEWGYIGYIIKNSFNWDYDFLINEFENYGLLKLLPLCGVEAKKVKGTIRINATIEEVAEKISSSSFLLYPEISHYFDRLHLIVALLKRDTYLEFSDGWTYSNLDFFMKIVNEFDEKDASAEKVIAAEQFYTRIVTMINLMEQYFTNEVRLSFWEFKPLHLCNIVT